MSEDNATPVSSILVALSIGALVGVGLALLYAPRSGKETREFIADTSRDMKDKAEGTVHGAEEFISEKKAILIAAAKAGRDAAYAELAKNQSAA